MAECSPIATKLCGAVVKPGCGVSRSSFDGSTAVFEAVAFAVHFQDVDMMGQPVEKRAREALRSECAGPFIARQVGCHAGGPALVAL